MGAESNSSLDRGQDGDTFFQPSLGLNYNEFSGGAWITLCEKGIYARGLAHDVLALVKSFVPASQLIDLRKEKAEIKFSDIGHIAVDKTRIKSYYFNMHWSIQESKQERKRT